MNTKTIQSLSLIVIFIAALIFSQTARGQNVYVGGELGRSSYNDDIDLDTEVIRLDGDATSFRVAVGYDLNRYFSVEGGYINFGKIEFGDVDVGGLSGSVEAQADGWEFCIIGRIPVGSRFSLLGRTGLLWWDAKTQVIMVNDRLSKRDTFFGFGGEFAATEKLGITTGWTRYDLDSDNIDYLSIGLRFRFGSAD